MSGARAPRVVVVGDVAVDVLVTPAAPAVPGADVPARIRMAAGGAGANTAAWLAHLGAEVTLVARVGDDAPGRAAAAELAAAGVRPVLTVDPTAPTCTVVVLVDDGDRTMLSDRGAAARLSPGDLPALDGPGRTPVGPLRPDDPRAGSSRPAHLRADPPDPDHPRSDHARPDRPLADHLRVDHLHLSGYVLLDASSRPAGLAALASARAAGLSTSVDPQAAPALTPAFREWVRGVDLLLPNADELLALGGPAAVLPCLGPPPGLGTPPALGTPPGLGAPADLGRLPGRGTPPGLETPADLGKLPALGTPPGLETPANLGRLPGRGTPPARGAVAVTDGARGATWHDRRGCWTVAAPAVEVVDATGAGDAFDAGLLMAWLAGAGPADALRAGCAAGAAAVQLAGARPGRA